MIGISIIALTRENKMELTSEQVGIVIIIPAFLYFFATIGMWGRVWEGAAPWWTAVITTMALIFLITLPAWVPGVWNKLSETP